MAVPLLPTSTPTRLYTIALFSHAPHPWMTYPNPLPLPAPLTFHFRFLTHLSPPHFRFFRPFIVLPLLPEPYPILPLYIPLLSYAPQPLPGRALHRPPY